MFRGSCHLHSSLDLRRLKDGTPSLARFHTFYTPFSASLVPFSVLVNSSANSAARESQSSTTFRRQDQTRTLKSVRPNAGIAVLDQPHHESFRLLEVSEECRLPTHFTEADRAALLFGLTGLFIERAFRTGFQALANWSCACHKQRVRKAREEKRRKRRRVPCPLRPGLNQPCSQ